MSRVLGIGLAIVIVSRIALAFGNTGIKAGDLVRITGRVTSDPVQSGTKQRFLIEEYLILGKADDEIRDGDTVEVEGEVGQSGRLMSIDAQRLILIRRDGEGGENDGILSAVEKRLRRVRSWVRKIGKENFPASEAGLFLGTLVGDKKSIPYSFYEKLKKSGTTHVVVASGTNVSLVGSWAVGLLYPLVGRWWAVIFATWLVWGFALLAGGGAAVVRAALMASLAYAALLLGRPVSTLRLLSATALIMVMVSPKLVTDLGFQLSFAATLGIVVFELPEVKKRLGKLSGFGQSLFAQIFTLPVLVLSLGWQAVSWVGPIVNWLVLWLVGPIMLGGIGVLGVFGLAELTRIGVIYKFGQFLSGLEYVPLHLFVMLVNWFSAI